VSDEQIALASPPVNEAWNRLSPCDDRSMTPGRLVSLDALSGITVAAKIRIERSPRVGSDGSRGARQQSC